MTSNGMYVPELTRVELNKLSKCHNNFMIGRLRDDNSTNITKNDDIQFFVNSLCDDPQPAVELGIIFSSSEEYIGFTSQQNRDVLPLSFDDPNNFDVSQKAIDLEKEFANKLIIFHPFYVNNIKEQRWFKNIKIVRLFDDNKDQYKDFKMIPRIQIGPAKFEQILKKGEYFDLLEFDGEINEAPNILICGTYAYRMRVPNSEEWLVPNPNVWTRWKCVNVKDIVKIDISKLNHAKGNMLRASDNIVFLEDSLVSNIFLSKNYVPFEEDKRTEVIQQSIENEKQIQVEKNSLALDENQETSEDEIQFLNALQQLTLENGLQYEIEDLVNFHTSIKTNPLTILAGMSGTGKSRLALNYAKMLNLSEDNNNLLFMPISPSYTEPTDVLGYLNSMNGLYVPSETGLVQFLIHAEENPDQMHMAIFDEMNLSQVEYWFSPFISILEKDLNERILTLYDEDSHCINEKVYPPKIKIGENVIFVGTVNIDDTTKDFSDRLLDRTFVIKLKKVSFRNFYNNYLSSSNKSSTVDIQQAKCKNVNQFASWRKGDDRTYMDAFMDHSEELDLLDALDNLIKKYIPDGGISYRVLKNIGNYILNVPCEGNRTLLERGDIIDIVINQTVMTKIRGTEMQLQELIGTLSEDNSSLNKSKLLDLLNEYNSISNFERVKNSLKTKAEELRINGYTN